jgi:hypothetical protein
MQLLDRTLDECQRTPDAFAFLCDQLAASVVRGGGDQQPEG